MPFTETRAQSLNIYMINIFILKAVIKYESLSSEIFQIYVCFLKVNILILISDIKRALKTSTSFLFSPLHNPPSSHEIFLNTTINLKASILKGHWTSLFFFLAEFHLSCKKWWLIYKYEKETFKISFWKWRNHQFLLRMHKGRLRLICIYVAV